ncbi:MAG: hypothetical protein HFF15_06545 [Angelakisella sp.]|jgi:hypothetical protein|nr:hypothetical protein [Angelakisella sp.]
MKKTLCLFLSTALLLLTACGENSRARPSSEAPKSPSSLSTQPPPQEQEPAPEPSQSEEALVREIVMTYGAEESTPKDGSVRLVAKMVSLLNMGTSWSHPEELSTADYWGWFLSTTFDEDYEYKLEHYTHPELGEGSGWFFPQELFEERVQRYFGVSTERLRDSDYYDPALSGYWAGGGGGVGERPEITYTYVRDGDALTIDLELHYEYSQPAGGRLYVTLGPEGSWKYTGWDCRPTAYALAGCLFGEGDFLTPEQWALLERAEGLTQTFQVDASHFPGDDLSGFDPTLTQEIGGYHYTLYQGKLYQGWEDFYQDMLSVFTAGLFDELNRSADGGTFAGWGNERKLYFRDGARGTNLYYLPGDRYALSAQYDHFIHLSRYSFYCAPEELGEESPEPFSMRYSEIVLQETPSGWRVERYSLPY